VVELWTNRGERMESGSRLFAGDRMLEVEQASSLPEGGRRSRWLVSFGGVGDREGAERLRDLVLLAEPLQVEGVLWVHELIGAEIFDATGGRVGVIESVEANPASDLLVLADGRLVPLTFVSRDAGGRLTVTGPPGLLDP
jgi:16S rRNA processing protein RimM